jgi:hypothetical protein
MSDFGWFCLAMMAVVGAVWGGTAWVNYLEARVAIERAKARGRVDPPGAKPEPLYSSERGE